MSNCLSADEVSTIRAVSPAPNCSPAAPVSNGAHSNVLAGITFVRVNLFSLVSGTPAPIRQAMQDFVEKFEPKEHSVIVLLTHLPVYQVSLSRS